MKFLSMLTPMGILAMTLSNISCGSRASNLVRDNNDFALDFYHQVRTEDGNLFFSPYSLSIALAMTYAGARAETAEQMARVLHFELRGEDLHEGFRQIEADLATAEGKAGVELAQANSLWPHQNVPFLEEFLTLIETYYGATIIALDYGEPEKARAVINGWVAEKTRQKIDELLPEGILDSLTALVLTNAIYFKGNWAIPFDPGSTQRSQFQVSPGKSVPVQMMAKDSQLRYAANQELQILEMPYEGNDLSMILLLPQESFDLAEFESKLTGQQLASWIESMEEAQVLVFLPRFKLTWKAFLNKTLTTMGMSDAFSAKADFSGMNGSGGLFISQVIHEATVEVHEEGTEASAATAVVMSRGAPRKAPTFRADRPFLFLIRDQRSGAILFLGRVVDPS